MPAADAAPALADAAAPFDAAELSDLFDRFSAEPALVLAVSGGPDSMGLMAAAARWRASLSAGPVLHVATVDHGLRPEAAAECAGVVEAATGLVLAATVLRWTGDKPTSGLQEAAREARYCLLADHARAVGARLVMTAHTISDQAETVLMRLVRGSGPLGLKGMAAESPRGDVTIVRPFLWESGARLAATAGAAGLHPIQDPSNADDRFTRVRIRKIMAALAAEGLDAERLAILAGRTRMVDEALRHQANALAEASALKSIVPNARVFDATKWRDQPLATLQVLLSTVLAEVGDAAIAERLEALEMLSGTILMAVDGHMAHRETLRGALVTVTPEGRVIVTREPARRQAPNGASPQGSIDAPGG